MFLSLNRTVKELPNRHALAYARAEDDAEFGRIVRNEVDNCSAKRSSKTKASPKTKIKGKPKAKKTA
jgi:hypothetical protein